ncbi:hypothetical protein [Halomonas sp. G11]|uniref:hypothetical protein n=1 Tax=Halomonas sp. G11 TaxID=1684425 RepID=UPI0007FDAF28|nr:hypothetical protein [Halomonas sp. G11]OAZ99179.1 hypothetical protein ADS46_01875 [Halomonas sp. G11]
MKYITSSRIASVTSIFPQKRREIKPVGFVSHESDEAAMRGDFIQVGKDMQKAIEQYGRNPQPYRQ